MERSEVFAMINAERAYQDDLWPPHEGHKRGEHCLSMLHVYTRKAEDAWNNGDSLTMWRQIGKLAAVISRALESQENVNLAKGGLR